MEMSESFFPFCGHIEWWKHEVMLNHFNEHLKKFFLVIMLLYYQ